MIKRALVVLAVLSVAPGLVAGQGMELGLGGRVGTLGLGGELAVGVNERVVVRGGIGLFPYEPTITFDDIETKLDLPTVYNVGVDLYVNGAMRLGGGVLFRSDDPSMSATFTQDQDIGGTTYTPSQIGTLTGVLDQNDRALYALIGFGRHTAPGMGLFIDLGVVFVGDPTVRLTAEGGSLDPATDSAFRSALDQEAADFQEDVGGYLKVYPILSLGFRLGVQ